MSDKQHFFIKKKLWKSAISNSIKLPFDAVVDEKFLNVTYDTYAPKVT